jgi:cytochrome c oxidase cbb3-type subunit 3
MQGSTVGAYVNRLGTWVLLAAVLMAAFAFLVAQILVAQTKATKPVSRSFPPAVIERGQSLFTQDCAFCHGRDAGGGESGPDLTRSKLIATDIAGDKIGAVVRNGRPEKGMPSFKLSPQQVVELSAFLHDQKRKNDSRPGGRRGVDVADLQTGNVEAGRKYFNGAGTCSSCHSPTGDLAGVARRFVGLALEKRMLYPADAPAKVTVTLPSGESLTGTLSYRDEFTVGMNEY